MNEISDPLDYLIELCENALNTDQWVNWPPDWVLTKFTILNAKDELKRLRQISNFELRKVAWASINNRGDIYHLTTTFNMYQDPVNLIPLYCNEKEYKEKYGSLS